MNILPKKCRTCKYCFFVSWRSGKSLSGLVCRMPLETRWHWRYYRSGRLLRVAHKQSALYSANVRSVVFMLLALRFRQRKLHVLPLDKALVLRTITANRRIVRENVLTLPLSTDDRDESEPRLAVEPLDATGLTNRLRHLCYGHLRPTSLYRFFVSILNTMNFLSKRAMSVVLLLLTILISLALSGYAKKYLVVANDNNEGFAGGGDCGCTG